MKKRNDAPSSTERFVQAQYINQDGTIEVYSSYMVSDHGMVASLVDTHGNKRRVMKILKPLVSHRYLGYLQVNIHVNTKMRTITVQLRESRTRSSDGVMI